MKTLPFRDLVTPHHWQRACEQKMIAAPTGNRTQGKRLEGVYVTTTPLVLYLLMSS